MKAINIDKKNIFYGAAIFVVGMFLGWLFFGRNGSPEETSEHKHEQAEKATVWTCSMHPQIKQNKPGKCPICAMDLVSLSEMDGDEDASPDEIRMSKSAMKIADVQTIVVQKQNPEKEVYLLGKIKPDERLIYSQTAHIPGRIEKLYVNFTGEKVHKGQKLAALYSPELVTAQKELYEVLKDGSSNPKLVKAARNKLKLWKFTDEQIKELEENGEMQTEVDILSDHHGYVIKRNVALGDYIIEGQSLFQIVNLSKVWVMFEAYESDLPWIKLNDEVEIEVKSLPGKKFSGKVSYIDPFLNPQTRVANVRVELANSGTILKPDMFANGIIRSKLSVNKPLLLIPKSSVLWTGKRAVVYVKVPNREQPSFIYREITLGEDAGDFYIVKEGLEEGEVIATNGVFKIDAAAQLQGKASMMNPAGGKTSTGHDHGAMKMDGGKGMNMKKGEDHSSHSEKNAMEITEFRVSGNCGMCKERIEKAANAVQGVKSAVWDENSKILKLLFNGAQTSEDLVSKAIAKVGHSTEYTNTEDEVYDALPACCQYSKEEN